MDKLLEREHLLNRIRPKLNAITSISRNDIKRLDRNVGRITSQKLDKLRQEEVGITHYTWRTRDDSRVRGTHAENDDKVFAWDAPPATGHPGDEFGCRCYAEPVLEFIEEVGETIDNIHDYLLSLIESPWEWYDFGLYSYVALGKPVTLRRIGHLKKVIEVARQSNHLYDRVHSYYKRRARGRNLGTFNDTSSNTYDFTQVNIVYGDSTVNTEIQGEIIERAGKKVLTGRIIYNFNDEFTDIFDIHQILKQYTAIEDSQFNEIAKFLIDFPRIAYDITDTWVEEVEVPLEDKAF